MPPAARPQHARLSRRRLRRRDAEHARFRGRVPAARAHVLGHRAHARRAHPRQPQEDERLPPFAAAAGGRVRRAADQRELALLAQLRRHRRRLGLQAHGDAVLPLPAPSGRCRSPHWPFSSAALPRSATRSGSSARISTVSSSAAAGSHAGADRCGRACCGVGRGCQGFSAASGATISRMASLPTSRRTETVRARPRCAPRALSVRARRLRRRAGDGAGLRARGDAAGKRRRT